jgi:hypothetical protein
MPPIRTLEPEVSIGGYAESPAGRSDSVIDRRISAERTATNDMITFPELSVA